MFLLLHGFLILFSSKGYFICTIYWQLIPWFLLKHWLEREMAQWVKKGINLMIPHTDKFCLIFPSDFCVNKRNIWMDGHYNIIIIMTNNVNTTNLLTFPCANNVKFKKGFIHWNYILICKFNIRDFIKSPMARSLLNKLSVFKKVFFIWCLLIIFSL